MEVKMFICNRPEDAEMLINEWLGKHLVQIHHITQSQCEKAGKLLFVVSLYYSTNLSVRSELQNKEKELIFG